MAEKELKDLEIGKTKIGQSQIKFEGEVKSVDVFYGNIAFVKAKDGTNKQVKLPKETYDDILKAFLTGPGGKIYKVPNPNEAKQIEEILSNKVAEGINTAHFERVEKSIESTNSRIVGVEQQIAGTTASLQEIKEMVSKINEESDEDDEEYEDDEPSKTPLLVIIGLIVAILLSGASAAFAALNFISEDSTPTVTETNNDKKSENTLVINGEEYTIEQSEINLDDGESNMAVYGIITTNENGKAVKKVIPLGNTDLSGSASKKATEKPAETSEATE